MDWFFRAIRSSIGKKIIMGLTGLFLCSFLLIHLSGNLALFSSDGGKAFNEYTKFMTTNGLIRVMEIVLLLGFLIHILDALRLSSENKIARPKGYAVTKSAGASSLASRNMGITGTVILAFLIIHIKSYWYEYHFGPIDLDSFGNKDMYKVVLESFHQGWYVLIYIFAILLMGVHISHGFQSAFQSLGFNHNRFTPLIKKVGTIYAVVLTIGFMIIPLFFYFNQ